MIDYQKIADAVIFYRSLGYNMVDAPWFVSRQALEVTAPPNKRYCSSFLGDMVASGEQSFIQLWMDDVLKDGLHVCVTPCFRDEEVVDKLHLNRFLKVELIEINPSVPLASIEQMILDAADFFSYYVGMKNIEVINTDIGKDIVCKGIELGSYGYREQLIDGKMMKWAYGTGCAEPRLSQVQKRVVVDIAQDWINDAKQEI
jgi:hypothetical protein